MKTMTQNKTAVQPQSEEIMTTERDVKETSPAEMEQAAVPAKGIPASESQEHPPKADREWIMSKGLCATCNEAPDCAYARQAEAPILFCEMFDDSQPDGPPQVEEKKDEVHSSEMPATESHLKGLCVNCENRQTCAFPKPPEGIWHCEEYR